MLVSFQRFKNTTITNGAERPAIVIVHCEEKVRHDWDQEVFHASSCSAHCPRHTSLPASFSTTLSCGCRLLFLPLLDRFLHADLTTELHEAAQLLSILAEKKISAHKRYLCHHMSALSIQADQSRLTNVTNLKSGSDVRPPMRHPAKIKSFNFSGLPAHVAISPTRSTR